MENEEQHQVDEEHCFACENFEECEIVDAYALTSFYLHEHQRINDLELDENTEKILSMFTGHAAISLRLFDDAFPEMLMLLIAPSLKKIIDDREEMLDFFFRWFALVIYGREPYPDLAWRKRWFSQGMKDRHTVLQQLNAKRN